MYRNFSSKNCKQANVNLLKDGSKKQFRKSSRVYSPTEFSSLSCPHMLAHYCAWCFSQWKYFSLFIFSLCLESLYYKAKVCFPFWFFVHLSLCSESLIWKPKSVSQTSWNINNGWLQNLLKLYMLAPTSSLLVSCILICV
jgi:hypothetical protein